MIKPEQCAKEEVLVPAVKAGGIKDVRISSTDDGSFIVAVELKRTSETFYLATRRNPDEPRKFKRIDVAIASMTKMIGARKFTVILENTTQNIDTI